MINLKNYVLYNFYPTRTHVTQICKKKNKHQIN